MEAKLDEGVAIAAIGLAVMESIKIYCNTAPSLKDIRSAQPYDYQTSQLILDADMLGIVVVLALGGGGAFMVRRWYPFLLAAGALLLVSAYYRSVVRSTNDWMINE